MVSSYPVNLYYNVITQISISSGLNSDILVNKRESLFHNLEILFAKVWGFAIANIGAKHDVAMCVWSHSLIKFIRPRKADKTLFLVCLATLRTRFVAEKHRP